MAQLAIKGHASRGTEIIKILSMLGGNNALGYFGNNTAGVYYVDKSHKNDITCSRTNENNLIFTLEEFIEKFPYKVGDKVQHKGATSYGSIFEVEKMQWEGDTVMYTLCLFGCNYKRSTLPAEYLQPYKEETVKKTMEEIEDKAKAPNLIGEDYSEKRYGYKIPDGYELDCIKNDEIILKPKQPQYPKTCEECCKILKIPTNGDIIYAGNWTWGGEYLDECLDKIRSFQKILICRDAYWQLAGEQMGLGKPWEPDWTKSEYKFCIINMKNKIVYDDSSYISKLLAFPTAELRNAFYEYFKDLIEECKELL